MGARILVVDDDPWMQRMVAGVLERRGYEVHCAGDAAAALARAAEGPFDLVISDVTMPGLDGWALARALRQRSAVARAPFVFLVAADAEPAPAELVRRGLDAILPKPVHLVDLDRLVMTTLARAPAPAPVAMLPMDVDVDVDLDGPPAPAPVVAEAAPAVAAPTPPAPRPALYASPPAGALPPWMARGMVVQHRPPATVADRVEAAFSDAPDETSEDSDGDAAPSHRVPGRVADRTENHAENPSDDRASDDAPTGFRGSLAQISLASLLNMMQMERRSGILVLRRGKLSGRLFLCAGSVVRAAVGERLRGADAVYHLLAWSTGDCELTPMPVEMEDEIGIPTEALMLEAARRMDEDIVPEA